MKILPFLISLLLLICLASSNINAQNVNIEVYIGLSPYSMYSVNLGTLKLMEGDSLWIKTSNPASIHLISPIGTLVKQVNYDPKIWNYYPILLYNFTNKDLKGLWKIDIYSEGLLLKSFNVELVDSSLEINSFNYDFDFSSDFVIMNYNFSINKSNFFNNSKYYLLLLTSYSYVNYTESIIRAIIGGEEIPARPVGIGYFNVENNVIENSKAIEIKIKPVIYNETTPQRVFVMEKFEFKSYYYATYYKEVEGTKILTYVPILIKQSSIKNYKINQDYLTINLDKGNIRTTFLTIELFFSNRTPYIEFRHSFQIFILNDDKQIRSFFILNKKELNITNNANLVSGKVEFNPLIIFKLLKAKQENVLKELYIGIVAQQEGITGAYVNKIKAEFFALNFINLIENSTITNFEIEGNTKIKNYKGNVLGIGNLTDFSLYINNVKIPMKLLGYENIYITPYQYQKLSIVAYRLNVTIMSGDTFIYNATLIITSVKYNLQLTNITLRSYSFSTLLPVGNYIIKVKKEGFEDHELTITMNSNKDVVIDLKPIPRRLSEEFDYSSLILLLTFVLLIEIIANLYVYFKIKSLKKYL
jgi:hypothetical protein